MDVVELLKEKDIQEVSDLICTTAEISFKYYVPQKEIENIKQSLNYDGVKKRASWTHFYVIKNNNKIVACGAIGPYWGSETESSLFSIFVHPDYQNKGYGRKIIETLEKDEYFTRAKRIEIPASLRALPFYLHFGYRLKNDEYIIENYHIVLEKFN
ncbi:MAG: GNAT family N-acetyltransferase [Clostridia bacterium]|nr:GNAT family N-acetyltransferase [Clostridia bacterium]